MNVDHGGVTVIAGGRQTGRTERAIELAKANNATVLVWSHDAAMRIEERDPDVKAMSMHKVKEGCRESFVIDNLLYTGFPRSGKVIGFTVQSTDVINTNDSINNN